MKCSLASPATFKCLALLWLCKSAILTQVHALGEAGDSLGSPNEADENQSQAHDASHFDRLLSWKLKHTNLSSLSLDPRLQDKLSTTIKQIQLNAYKVFMRLHNKSWPAGEIARRLRVFLKRRQLVEQLNRAYNAGKQSFYLRQNIYLDWFDSELKHLNGVVPPRGPAELMPEERQLLEADKDVETDTLESRASSDGRTSRWTLDQLVNDASGRLGQLHRRFIRSTESPDGGPSGGLVVGDSASTRARSKLQVPARVDWRDTGCISKPINQWGCGACYAIATIGAVEAKRCLAKQSESPLLSSQQIVDCTAGLPEANGGQNQGVISNYGCDGGWPTRVLEYLRRVGAVAREACYPFVGEQVGPAEDRSCRLRQVYRRSPGCILGASTRTDRPQRDVKLTYKVLNNEADILYHVATTGPVVTVLQSLDSFIYYAGGVYDDPECSKDRNDVDHAVLIVGYGRERGIDYWLIKNSWGIDTWGQRGYGKIRRGVNACSIGYWGWVVLS